MRLGLVLLGLAACAGEEEEIPIARLELALEAGAACDDDDVCVVSHNPCTAVAHCSHVDEIPGTIDIVCDPPRYLTPPDSDCVCESAAGCEVRVP